MAKGAVIPRNSLLSYTFNVELVVLHACDNLHNIEDHNMIFPSLKTTNDLGQNRTLGQKIRRTTY